MLEYLELEMNACKEEIEQIQVELNALPDGYLVRRGNHYSHRVNHREKGITKNRNMIRQLARKKYLKVRLKRLKTNFSVTQRLLNVCKKDDPKGIIAKLPAAYHHLPIESFFYTEEDSEYHSNPFPKEWNYITNKGVAVRSKSELIIANILELCEIPYQYEAELRLDDQLKYPDFTVRRPSDGSLVIWEHFGMLNQPSYVDDMKRKLILYAEHGYLPFMNLVCTYEDDVRNSKRIHKILDIYQLR